MEDKLYRKFNYLWEIVNELPEDISATQTIEGDERTQRIEQAFEEILNFEKSGVKENAE